MELSKKQKKFVDEWFKDFNGKQAAIRAGYSKATAEVQASRLLSIAKVKNYITQKQEKLRGKMEVNEQNVLEAYRRLAFHDPRQMFDTETGQLKAIPDMDEETVYAMAGFDVMEEFDWEEKTKKLIGYTKKVKLSDRRAALDSICRMLGYNAPVKTANTTAAGEDVKPISDEVLDKIAKLLGK